MVKKLLISLLLLTCFGDVFSQTDNLITVRTTIYEGDTIPFIMLSDIYILAPLNFKSQKDFKRYMKLVVKIKKTLPYARLAANKLIEIEARIDEMESEREKRKFINEMDKQLKAEFEGELTALTISEGRILIKLIDRETGETSYELIKQLKGSVTAFMWQSFARMFGSNLKDEFNAKGEDQLIDDIVIRLDNGLI